MASRPLFDRRAAAYEILCTVLVDGRSLTHALEHGLSLAPQADRPFIQALCYGVLRRYERLVFILGQLLHKPLTDETIQIIALIGLQQLSAMRVQPYAAVAETVNLVREKGPRALLNALLRRYQRERETLERIADENDSAALLHPEWLIARLRDDWPEYAQALFAANREQPPMILRVNRLRQARDAYRARLAEHGMSALDIPGCEQALLLEQAVEIDKLPGFDEGWVSVQDGAAQWAAPLLELAPGLRVLDVCAAPGGKTAHILECAPDSDVVALDIDPQRAARITSTLQRLGLQAQVICGDARQPETWWDGKPFDRILLDAPCSALGVIRRHPDIKRLRRSEDIPALLTTQRHILDTAWRLLKPGGLLLYATCSVLKDENERQIAAFIARHPDATERPFTLPWGERRTPGWQLLTGQHQCDGFYYARLTKKP